MVAQSSKKKKKFIRKHTPFRFLKFWLSSSTTRHNQRYNFWRTRHMHNEKRKEFLRGKKREKEFYFQRVAYFGYFLCVFSSSDSVITNSSLVCFTYKQVWNDQMLICTNFMGYFISFISRVSKWIKLLFFFFFFVSHLGGRVSSFCFDAEIIVGFSCWGWTNLRFEFDGIIFCLFYLLNRMGWIFNVCVKWVIRKKWSKQNNNE